MSTDDQDRAATAGTYEAPRLVDLGTLADVTQGGQRNSAGDGVSLNGPRIGSR